MSFSCAQGHNILALISVTETCFRQLLSPLRHPLLLCNIAETCFTQTSISMSGLPTFAYMGLTFSLGARRKDLVWVGVRHCAQCSREP